MDQIEYTTIHKDQEVTMNTQPQRLNWKHSIKVILTLLVISTLGIIWLTPVSVKSAPNNTDSVSIIFQDNFNSGLGKWKLFGSPTPYIDTSFGNPKPSYQNNGDGMYSNGATSKQYFTPKPGMIFQVDLQISSYSGGHHWMGFGLERILNPTETNSNPRFFVSMGADTSKIYIGDCAQRNLTDTQFHRFKFIVLNDLRLKAYKDGLYICTTSFNLAEFVNKPLAIEGREGHADNVLVTKP
jgi:hypothetical protein